MARILGLEGPSDSLDDALVLGDGFSWNFDPNNRGGAGGYDAIGAIEHEISEGGMGRIGGLGFQNNMWGPMDLFRFTSAGQRDYTGGQDGVTTYFSPNGSSPDLTHPYHNSVNAQGTFDGEDPGDWEIAGDSFGFGSPGVPDLLSATDIRVMDILGWNTGTTSPGSVSINDVSLTEGNSGTKLATFTVTRTGGTAAFSVNYATSDGSATVADGDYVAKTGELQFGANVNTQTISVTINADTKFETDETFFVSLSGATNGATISDNPGIGTILNDDRVTVSDFNADGHSDLMWQNDTGEGAIWWMNGISVIGGGSPGNPGSSWHVKGTGDFNGDARSDILWQNSSGEVVIWEMNGTSVIGGGSLGNPGTSWHAISTGYFNADGFSDVLWQNDNGAVAIWEMAGTTIIGGGVLAANPGTSWHAKGAGDFNGDGLSDILWQNDNGAVAIWEMSGTTPIGGGAVAANPGPAWHVVSTGDFNGDGHSDILYQNSNGDVAIWDMSGTAIVGGGEVANPGTGWRAVTTGDYNSDGNSDILLQNSNGQAAIWLLSGTTIAGGGLAGLNPGTSWHLQVG
jgi:Calx-beta domain-containing protein/VCBS repeat protein